MKVLLFILGVSAALIIIGALIHLACLLDDWHRTKAWADKYAVFISFKQFKSLYSIAPDKWDLRDDYAIYKIYKPGVVEYYSYAKDCIFKHFFDYIQYLTFLDKHKKKQKENIRDESLAEVLKAWQNDINEYRQKSLEELKAEREKIDAEIVRYQMEKVI